MNHKFISVKLLEDTVGENFFEQGLGKACLDDIKSVIHKTNKKIGLHQNLTFCSMKDPARRINRTTAEWEKYFQTTYLTKNSYLGHKKQPLKCNIKTKLTIQ